VAASDKRLDSDDLHLELARRLHEAGPGCDSFAVITGVVSDLYDKVHPVYLGSAPIVKSHWLSETDSRTKTRHEVCNDLHDLAVKWGWISVHPRDAGALTPMHEAEVSLFSIRSRKRLESIGMGWRVEKDGSYSMLSRPAGETGSRQKRLWANVVDDERFDFVLGWLSEMSWALGADTAPADDDYHRTKLLTMILAAHAGGLSKAGTSPNLSDYTEGDKAA
jgi:hypothetical protein